jgi:anti-anti-sigma regulatory factor
MKWLLNAVTLLKGELRYHSSYQLHLKVTETSFSTNSKGTCIAIDLSKVFTSVSSLAVLLQESDVHYRYPFQY